MSDLRSSDEGLGEAGDVVGLGLHSNHPLGIAVHSGIEKTDHAQSSIASQAVVATGNRLLSRADGIGDETKGCAWGNLQRVNDLAVQLVDHEDNTTA